MNRNIELNPKAIALSALGEPISVELRRSLKAKNIAIRIKSELIELVIPHRVAEKLARKFLLSKEKWIREKLKNRRVIPTRHRLIHGEYSMLNNIYKLKHISTEVKLPIFIDDNHIVAHTSQEHLFDELTIFFKERAITEIKRLAEALGKQHKFEYNKVVINGLKSRWGSCSSLKNLAFNWRIIFAPPSVLHYLVTHELCHLKEMNHGREFWKLVETIAPDYKEAKKWLKEQGYTLYHYLNKN